MFWSLLATAWVVLAQATEPAPEAAPEPERRLTRKVDAAAATRCRGALAGFANVPVQCVVSENGSLRQCELLTDNRAALRLKSHFQCMAAAVYVFDETGAPAVGLSVTTRFNGPDLFGPNPR